MAILEDEETSLQEATDSILLATQIESDRGALESVGYFVTSTVVSGVAQLVDIPTSIGNMFGDDEELIDIEDTVYKVLGEDAADFYADNKPAVDVGGFIASSLVPGMAGVKGLTAAQAAVRTATAGKQLHPFYKAALGVVAPRTEVALEAVKAKSAIENTGSLFRADALKAIASNAQQTALETVAFELAVAGTMSSGEVLDELTTKQMVDNMIFGVGVGAGIGGLFSTIKVSGAIRSGIQDNAEVWNKYSLAKVPDETLPPSTKAAMYINFMKDAPVAVKGTDEMRISGDEALNSEFARTMESNSEKVMEVYRTSALKELTELMDGDGASASMLLDKSLAGGTDRVAESLLGLKEFMPVGAVSKAEQQLKKDLAKVRKTLELKPSSIKVVYVDLVSDSVMGSAPSYTSIQDLGKKVLIGSDTVLVGKESYKVTPSLAHNIEFKSLTPREHEARAIWLNSKSDKFFKNDIFKEDLGALDSVLARLKKKPDAFNAIKVRDADGSVSVYTVADDLDAFKQFHAQNKLDVAMRVKTTKVLGDTLEAKADSLRKLTGIPFTIGAGANSISKTMLMKGTLANNLKKIVRGNVKVSAQAVLDTPLSEGAKSEARKLSRELLGKPKLDRSDIELLTDAKLMLSVLPDSARVKYPNLMNEYGTSMTKVSDSLSSKFGFDLNKQVTLTGVARAANIPEEALVTGKLGVHDALHREARFDSLVDTRFKNQFELPFMHKATYDSSIIKVDENELRGAAKLAASVKIHADESQAVADSVIGKKFADILPDNQGEFLDSIVSRVDSLGTSANALTSSNRDYGHAGSFTKFIGAAVTRMREDAVKKVQDSFASVTNKILNDGELAIGWSSVNAKLRSLPGNYVLDEDLGQLVLREVKQYKDAGKGAKPPSALLDKSAVVSIDLKDFVPQAKVAELTSIIKTHVKVNGGRLTQSAKLDLVKTGRATRLAELTDVVYPIPVDRRAKPYFSYVFDNRIATGRQHTHMLYANTPDELKKLEQALLNDPDLGHVIKIRSQDSVMDYYDALGEVDLSRAVSSKSFSSEIIRKGLDAPYFVDTDPAVIANSLLDFHANGAKGVVRRAVETKYSAVFATLDKAAKQHSEYVRSTASTDFLSKVRRKITGDKAGKDPYVTYAAEMLGESNIDRYVWWKKINDSIDNLFDAVHVEVFSGWTNKTVTQDDLLKANKQLEGAGFKNAFVSPMTMELTNKRVATKTATSFVATVNSVLGFFVLRTDPMNAVNNMIGHNVLYNAELRDLLGLIKAKNPDSGILKMLELDLPGNGEGKVLNHGKIMAQAITDFWKRDDLRKLYTDIGYNLDISQQLKQLMGDAAIDSVENTKSIAAKHAKVMERINSGALKLEKASLNRFSEEMTNFLSARTAHIIVDHAVEAGVMSEKSKHAYINTFVNRVRGTYIASQRPAMFQGPIGMSMGLFQTYQINLLQQLFRYASSGRGNSSLYMMGLQASIYGANGIPGYHALNTKVVGDLEGNATNQDITGSVYQALGTKGGDWMMYGMASNALTMFGSDDLATNIYTRGDLNPRQITIVPINPLDAPWFAGWTKFFGNAYDTGAKLANGADVYGTFARGLEHNGVSRPLSGLGKAMQGMVTDDNLAYSTTKSGNLLATYDLVSVATLVGLAGGRTITEARSLDALYRKKAYDKDKSGDMQFLKSLIKTHAANNTSLGQEEYAYFLGKYVAKGGTQQQFRGFLMDAFKGANESSIKSAKSVNDSVYGKDMQAIMGGEFRDLYPE